MKLLKKSLAILVVVAMLSGCMALFSFAAPLTVDLRYSVLVLDVSGSMWGEPIEALKDASKSFCEQVLDSSKGYDKSNYVAIVTFDTYADILCEFTNDVNELNAAIDTITDRGVTNLADGIETATELLAAIPDSKTTVKNILIMCDGYPNEGYPDGETAAYNAAANVPMTVQMYGLYFGQDGYDQYAYELMENICRTDCYDATNVDELIFIFANDWSDNVTTTDVNNLVIRIACPVEVEVKLNGIVLNRNNPKTLFGTLEFEYVGSDEVKILTLAYSENYEITVTGTGTGTMDYSISYRCNDTELYSLTYPTVDITPETVISGQVSFEDKKITLDVDTNGDGVVDKNVLGTASDEEPVVDPDTGTIDKSSLPFWQKVKLFFKERLIEFYDYWIRVLTLYKSFL